MHLRYDWDPKTHHGYRASPDVWVVTDDFGTRFDALLDRQAGDPLPDSYRKRSDALYREFEDPDYFRLSLGRPQWHRISEAMAFSCPMGLSIELQLLLDFEIRPHWDEGAGDAYFDRNRGARIEILCLNASLVDDSTHPVTVSQAELEEYCWQYLDLKRKRETAGALTAAAEVLE
ncbi:hypothetical protein [Cupriavidus plantarum]|uniref:hypothetical protein n=1 Tax=Cupriavidus plantarum TaxID=942865 RepID=UPI000EAD639F|nr:hypothetical protein [Cupriavidus plantarum]RLK45967.1 hypothetical protein C7417_1998 [Cupriavidus plantarum]